MTTDRPRVHLVLEAMPDPNGSDPYRRLAVFLKTVKRAYLWRCLEAEEVRPEQPAKVEELTP